MGIFFIALASAIFLAHAADVSVGISGQSHSREVKPFEAYLLPAAFSSIADQRSSFFIAALYCILNNMTLVLPQWIFDYDQIETAVMKPFDYLYTIDSNTLNNLEDLQNFRYVKSLPSHLLSPCLSQLHASSSSFMFHPNSTILDQYAREHGVICVNGDATFFSIGRAVQDSLNLLYFLDFRGHPAVQSLNSVLILNELHHRIVDAFLLRMRQTLGHSDFISVHTTVEEEFLNACIEWPKRPYKEPNELQYYRACYEDDTAIYDLLTQSVSFPVNNSVLLILNHNRRDITFQDLPNLCNRDCSKSGTERCFVFHCIRKESLIGDAELFEMFPEMVQSASSVAFIDINLATHGILFLGNMYSTLSVEIMHERMLARTPYAESVFYNRLCIHQYSNLYDCK